MSYTINILQDGSLISPGSTPAEIRNGVIGYVQNPDDTEKLTLNFKGWLNGETLSSVTWESSNLTVGTVTSTSPTSYALVSGVPETGSGQIAITATSSGGRIKELNINFYGFQVTVV